MTIEQDIVDAIRTIRKHQGYSNTDFTLDTPLYDDGIGLDSLCVAELSSVLEKKYGKDPYTSGVLPQTVRDIISFYEA